MPRMPPSGGVWWRRMERAQSMALWIGRAHAYGLNSMKIGNSVPSPRVSRSGLAPSPNARQKPRPPSRLDRDEDGNPGPAPPREPPRMAPIAERGAEAALAVEDRRRPREADL